MPKTKTKNQIFGFSAGTKEFGFYLCLPNLLRPGSVFKFQVNQKKNQAYGRNGPNRELLLLLLS
jgi:hypothetical protein